MTWTVLETIIKNQRKHYLVQCTCGAEAEVRKDYIDSSRSKECKSCSAKRTAAKYGTPSAFKGVGNLSKTHYSAIKYGAIRRGIPFEISMEFLWGLFLQQEAKCNLTGVDIVLVPDIKESNPDWSVITASVDRIDSNLGYTEANVQWVHKEINRFKNHYSMKDFVAMCNLVSYHVNPDPSMPNDNLVGMKEQRLGGEESTNNPPTSAQHPSGMKI